jgi:hypothetical protein
MIALFIGQRNYWIWRLKYKAVVTCRNQAKTDIDWCQRWLHRRSHERQTSIASVQSANLVLLIKSNLVTTLKSYRTIFFFWLCARTTSTQPNISLVEFVDDFETRRHARYEACLWCDDCYELFNDNVLDRNVARANCRHHPHSYRYEWTFIRGVCWINRKRQRDQTNHSNWFEFDCYD